MARSTATAGPHLERAHPWRQTHCTKHRAAPHYREHHSSCSTKRHLVIRKSKTFLMLFFIYLFFFFPLEISGDEAFTQTPATGMCSAASIVITIATRM